MKKNFVVILILTTAILLFSCGVKTERTTTETAATTATTETAATAAIKISAPPPEMIEPAEPKLNLNEPLIGTLDDFGVLVTRTVNCAVSGQVLDQSLNEGEIIVGNCFAIHDNGWISQEGNNVFYVIAPKGGIRVRATVYDGVFFIIDAHKITLNQSIAAMTLVLKEGFNATNIQYHQLKDYGDPVK